MTAATAIVGTYINRRFTPHEAPTFGVPQANDVIESQGKYWALFHDGRRLRGYDVSADVAEYEKSVVIEMEMRQALARLAETLPKGEAVAV